MVCCYLWVVILLVAAVSSCGNEQFGKGISQNEVKAAARLTRLACVLADTMHWVNLR